MLLGFRFSGFDFFFFWGGGGGLRVFGKIVCRIFGVGSVQGLVRVEGLGLKV